MMTKPDFERLTILVDSAENIEDAANNIAKAMNDAEEELDRAIQALRDAEAKFNHLRQLMRWFRRTIRGHRDFIEGKDVKPEDLQP
jgi:DNA repair ATPase RecN